MNRKEWLAICERSSRSPHCECIPCEDRRLLIGAVRELVRALNGCTKGIPVLEDMCATLKLRTGVHAAKIMLQDAQAALAPFEESNCNHDWKVSSCVLDKDGERYTDKCTQCGETRVRHERVA